MVTPDLPEAARDDLIHRLRDELGYRVVAWSGMTGGTNNRLVRLDTDEGTPLVAKFYHRDQWNRLEREFGILSFLAGQGITGVPRPYLRSDAHSYAVYSFEPGEVRRPAELDTGQARAAAAFAAQLHDIRPDAAGSHLPPAIDIACSLCEQLDRIEGRLRAFDELAAGPPASDEVRGLCRAISLRDAVNELVARATAGLTLDDLAASVPPPSRRLTTGDFGVHNLLVRDDDGITVLDFEWGGWDDPARMVMGFVAHGGSTGLSHQAIDAFLGAYAAARHLPETEIARFERVGLLLDIEWVVMYATALTAEATAARRYATGESDPHHTLVELIARLKERPARAMAGTGYRFPSRV